MLALGLNYAGRGFEWRITALNRNPHQLEISHLENSFDNLVPLS